MIEPVLQNQPRRGVMRYGSRMLLAELARAVSASVWVSAAPMLSGSLGPALRRVFPAA